MHAKNYFNRKDTDISMQHEGSVIMIFLMIF